MSPAPAIPPGLRAAVWGLGIAVLGMGIALVASIDMFQRERAAGERMRMASQPLIDSLRAEIRRSRLADADRPEPASTAIDGLSPREIEALRARGLADPVADLKADLAKHARELIPVPAVLGGTMGFHRPDRIRVLNGRWVCADFDDGHIGGSMLLEYQVESGRIAWRAIATLEP